MYRASAAEWTLHVTRCDGLASGDPRDSNDARRRLGPRVCGACLASLRARSPKVAKPRSGRRRSET